MINYRRNDENLDLISQSEALEEHIKMLYDQNNLIEGEINKFIAEDDELATRLENRRSPSPTNHELHRLGDQCIQTYTAQPTEERLHQSH